MKKQKKPNKGFTLVELLIVIVIIGILAAVVIPSVSGWIEKANESGDVQTANAMTKDLISYFDSQIPDNITASDIRYALDKYDFQPKTANKGNAFWFDKSSGTIILKKAEDFVTSKSIFDVFADNYDYERSVEEIIPGYLYLNTAGSDLAGILASIHNIASEGDFKGIQSFFSGNNVTLPGFSAAQIAEIARHVSTFSPEDTLFISDFSSFSKEINSSSPFEVKRVVFADGIKTIPEYAAGRPDGETPLLTIEGTVSIPHSVSFIEANAFSNVRSIGGFRVRSMSALRLAIKDGKSLAFSQVIEDILGDSISLAKKMRGTAIADAHLFVKYADKPEEKTVVVNDTQYQVSYYPSTIAFKPQITFNSNFNVDAEKEFAAYTADKASEILASDYRLNYRKNLDGSITAEIKMFDEYGILATGELTYTPIEDMEIDFSKGILTFANVTRNLPSDADAEYNYVVYVNGTKLKTFEKGEMKNFVGVNGEWEARDKNAVTFSSENDAKEALKQIKKLAEEQNRKWVSGKEPTISSDGKQLTFSYTFKAENASNNSKLTGNTLTNSKSGTDNTVDTTYEIVKDSNVWKIKRTSKEESTNYNLTTVEYYAHDDKTSYDSLRSSFNGISSSNTAIFDDIKAYKYSQEFLNAVNGQSTANITVELVRKESEKPTTIISSTKSIEVNVDAMVFEEKLTGGGPNKQFYEFKDVPNSFIQGMRTDEILKLYGGEIKTYTGLGDKTFYNGIFTRNFIYIGKRTNGLYEDDKNTKIKADVFDEYGFVKNYNSSTDEIYSLDDKNSDGYKAVAEMLKRHYPNYQDDQINKLLEKAFFIRNSAGTQSVKKIDSTTGDETEEVFSYVHPQITDPYFLCVFVDDKDGNKIMKLYSLFERDSNSPTREVEFSYKEIPTGDKYDMEFSYIRGTTALEGEGTQENPYVFIKPDTNGAIGASDLFPAGTQWFNQIRFKGDSGSHQLFSYEDYSNYYLELDAGTSTGGQDIRKLTIYFRPDNVVFCAKYECYIELIDAHEAEKIVTNNVYETKEYDAYYYDKEGLGLGNQDFYGTITTTGAGFNFVYMNGYYGGDTVYQTEFEIKFGGTTKKFYVIRGDIMPDGRKLSEYLKNNTSFNGKYTFADKISMPTVTDWLDINKYACKEYYYRFTIDGKEITYYPYMVSDINAFYKSAHGGDAYNGKIYTNRAQCLVFSDDGKFVKVFDTGVRVTKNNSNKYDYKTVVPENGEFYIPAKAIGWGAGDGGTITAKTTRFYFVSTNDSDPHFFQYAATGKTSTQYPNYRVIDKVKGTKDFHVVSSKGLEYNLYSARIGLLDCGSYLNQGFDGQYPELTIQKDVIVQPNGTDPNGKNWSAPSDDNPNYNLPEYVHLIMANGISGRYVYLNANGSKNTYWLEMYAGNTNTPLEAGHKFSEYFGTGKAKTLTVNVYNYGMMITYKFRVIIVEESESLYISRMNYAVLKDNSGFRTYYVNTNNPDNPDNRDNDILICNERTQYISRNGYPVSIDLYGGTGKVPTDSPVIYVGSGNFSSEEEAINSVKNGVPGWQVFDRRISCVRLWITLTKKGGSIEKIDNKYVYITYAEISEGLAKYRKNHEKSILDEYNKGTDTYTKAEITGWSTQKHVLGSYSKNNDGSIDYTKEADPFRMTSGETKYLVLKVTIHREVEYMAIKLVGKAANDQTTNDEFVWTINEKWPEGKTTETFGAESNVTCYEFKFAPGEKLFDAGRSCQIMNLYTNVRDSFGTSHVKVWSDTDEKWVAYNAASWIVGDDGTYIKIVTGSGNKTQTFYAHITTEEAELNTSFAAVNNFNLEKQPLKAGADGYNIPTYTMTRGEPLQVGFGASRIYVKNGSQYTTGYVYARYYSNQDYVNKKILSGSYRLYIKYGEVKDTDIDDLLKKRFLGTPEGWTELVIPYEGTGSKNNDDREKTKFALNWAGKTQATVVYCYVGYGKEWRAAVNLKLDSENATPTVQTGIRRINNVPYYTDLEENLEEKTPVVITDRTDAKIKLSTSTIWYSYNGFIKSTSTFSATATKFYYTSTAGTKTEIAVTDGILDLSDILGQNQDGVTIIAEHTISNITYTCEFIVKAQNVKAKITKINNKHVTEDSGTVKVYKGERLFPNETITYNSTSIFVYGEKSATTYFYTNTNFKYYYSVPNGIHPIETNDDEGNIGYTCEIGGKTYDVIKEGKNYFYLVDMSNFVFNENGTLIVVYLDIYKTSVNIEVVETPAPVIIINNQLYLVPYRRVTDTDGNSSYEKLSANYPDMDKIGAATETEPFEFGINQYWQSLDKETLQLNFLLKDKLTLMDSSTSLSITLADGLVKNIGIRSWSAKIKYNETEYEYAKEEENLCKGLGKHKLTLSYTENGYTYVFEFWYTFKQN